MSIESQLEGLSGPLPDGITDGVALGTGLADGYDFYESAIGAVVVTFNPEGVSSVDMAEGFEERHAERFGRALLRAEAPRAWAIHIPQAIERGTPGSLPLDLRSVTEFQQQVLLTTATIPKGEVRPYGWVAREVHRPKAVRAVGSAVARNPVPLIIPCHRVIRSDGHIGNYSLGGPHNKVELLEHEGSIVGLKFDPEGVM
ncbi:MAG TPA: methylated-DNA--[protein]-cysteine S-methyltransferase [Acidimicrobiia bacterium]|nr:methylated-DNA--[protein]-cysteine S-methyltransferase [Acidimicrobiia bacterium]